MKTFLLSTLIILMGISISIGQEIRKISKAELVAILNDPADKLHVINFWATWCAPCIKELPDFQKIVNESDKAKIDFFFISMDFPSDAEKKLIPFLKKNNYRLNVYLMSETESNSWIDDVDASWQGNIPATLFFNRARKIHHFVAEPMDKNKIGNTIQSLL